MTTTMSCSCSSGSSTESIAVSEPPYLPTYGRSSKLIPTKSTSNSPVLSSKLKAVKNTITVKNTLSVAVSVMKLTERLAPLIPIPGAREVVSILTGMLEYVQKVQTDQEACLRLVTRAVDIIEMIYGQLESLDASAPTQLLRNLDHFIQTLNEVCDFMQAEANSKWHSRLFRIQSPSISQRLKEYEAKFEAARHDFELATLINIHHHVALPDQSLEHSTRDIKLDGDDATNISTETEPLACSVSDCEMRSCGDASDVVDVSNGENTIPLDSFTLRDSLFTYKAKALYGYTASDDDPNEISFSRGDIIDIIDKQGKWWHALKPDGTIGVVPSNYMQII